MPYLQIPVEALRGISAVLITYFIIKALHIFDIETKRKLEQQLIRLAQPDGAWGRKGDVKTHIFKIDPAAATITRTNGYTNVATNSLSVKYTCGKCHDSSMSSYVGSIPLTEEEAKAAAAGIHLP